jgi:hypothetical protein
VALEPVATPEPTVFPSGTASRPGRPAAGDASASGDKS